MKFRFLTIALLAGMLLAGCNKDNNEPNGGNTDGGDIVFNIGFAPQNDGKTGTRVATASDFKSTWEDGDAIGIYAVKRATGATGLLAASGNYMQNVKLTYNETDDKWTGGAYYTNDGDVLDLYAYYPYDVAATDPLGITFNVATDQSIAANYSKSDLLSAKQAGVAKGTTVDLTFSHMLALVQVDVAHEYIDRNGSFTATLRGCLASGTFNLGDGSLTTSGVAQTVKMLRVGTHKTYIYRAIVPAQSVPIGTNLCLMAQNGELYNTPALIGALDLIAGEVKLRTAKLPIAALPKILIKNGTFIMGSSNGSNIGDSDGSGLNTTPAEPNRGNDETQHSVTLTKDFYMSKYQVTSDQYALFLNAKGVGEDRKSDVAGFGVQELFTLNQWWNVKWENNQWVAIRYNSVSMISINWYGAKAYADWLSTETGLTCRLPTEAEWEYACRAGTTTAYSFGDDVAQIDGYAWHSGNSNSEPRAVGEKLPNPWGLYDMHGNVLEWCSDWYNADYAQSGTAIGDIYTDPPGPTAGATRVLRGGSWNINAHNCRSADRDDNPGSGNAIIGFRVVFEK